MRGRCIRGRGNRGFIAMLRGLLGRCGLEELNFGGQSRRVVLLLVCFGGGGGGVDLGCEICMHDCFEFMK